MQSTGPLARGQADTNDRPYKLSYTYDEMNHLTYRGGKHWSRFGGFANTGSGVYLNGRNTGWQYDVDGRLTNDSETQYTYDAAGRALTVISDEGNLTQSQTFDGDGNRTKMVTQQILQNELDGSTYTETTTRHFVTSSVTGRVITELDQSGEKIRTFVYQGGKVIAWQQKQGTWEGIAWEHKDLSDASVRIAGASDGSDSGEFEPLGSDAAMSNPFIYPPQRTRGEDLTYPGFANLMNSDCQIFGIPAPCDMVHNMQRVGAAYELLEGEKITDRLPQPSGEEGGQFLSHAAIRRNDVLAEVTINISFDESLIPQLLPSLSPQNSSQGEQQENLEKFKECYRQAAADRSRRERGIAKMGESLLPGADDIVPTILAGVGTGIGAARNVPEPRVALVTFLGAAAGSIGYSLIAVPIWKGLKNMHKRHTAYNESSKAYYEDLKVCGKKYGRNTPGGSW